MGEIAVTVGFILICLVMACYAIGACNEIIELIGNRTRHPRRLLTVGSSPKFKARLGDEK